MQHLLESPSRPRCATTYITPDQLTKAQLDDYLAKGWYRVGQGLVWCEAIALERGVRGVAWTRVPLKDFSFKKSSRRILNRVEREFEVTLGPVCLDEEHEALYQRYLTMVDGERNATMCELRFGQRNIDLFDTREITIRHRQTGALVGFSWFDVAEVSVESLIGVYNPDYARYSIGIYTMLREVQYCLEHGFEYFYAGYVLCQDPAMDYKLTPGRVEVLDRDTESWRAYETFDTVKGNPLNRTKQALGRVQEAVDSKRVVLHENRHFALSAYASALDACLAYPLVLLCPHSNLDIVLAVGWDTVTRTYEVLMCDRAALTSSLTQEILSHDLLVIRRSMGRFDSVNAAESMLYTCMYQY